MGHLGLQPDSDHIWSYDAGASIFRCDVAEPKVWIMASPVHGFVRVAARQDHIHKENHMADGSVTHISEEGAGSVDVITEVRREEALLKTGALQNAIFNSANFSSIAT